MSFEKQIMSKDKYPSIFSCQMEAVVFIINQIFFRNAHGFENWEYPQFWLRNILSCDAFRPIARGRKCLMDYKMKYPTRQLYFLGIYHTRA